MISNTGSRTIQGVEQGGKGAETIYVLMCDVGLCRLIAENALYVHSPARFARGVPGFRIEPGMTGGGDGVE
ncbi:MAG: hypothetical protein ABR512_05855 [Desulfopila sp.]